MSHPTLCLHQYNPGFIARCCTSTCGRADHLAVQIPDRLFVAVEVNSNRAVIGRISEVNRCVYRAGGTGFERIPVLLACCACGRAVVLEQAVLQRLFMFRVYV